MKLLSIWKIIHFQIQIPMKSSKMNKKKEQFTIQTKTHKMKMVASKLFIFSSYRSVLSLCSLWLLVLSLRHSSLLFFLLVVNLKLFSFCFICQMKWMCLTNWEFPFCLCINVIPFTLVWDSKKNFKITINSTEKYDIFVTFVISFIVILIDFCQSFEFLFFL